MLRTWEENRQKNFFSGYIFPKKEQKNGTVHMERKGKILSNPSGLVVEEVSQFAPALSEQEKTDTPLQTTVQPVHAVSGADFTNGNRIKRGHT